MKAVVDRIEGENAVLLVEQDQIPVRILIPMRLLPGIRESDILTITITKNDNETKEARERISSLIEKLKNKDNVE